jgi:ribose/xylose/arabinose/galactoside ABC-type transport system permease subunit
MSAGPRTASHRQRILRAVLPPAILAAVVIGMLALPLYSDASMTVFGVYNSFQNLSTLGLLALAVGLTIIIGEFDLSTLGMYALGGILAVKFGESEPLLGIAAAVLSGVLVGFLQGFIIAKSGISSVPLTLGGSISLLGLCHIATDEKTLAYGNYDIGLWLDSGVAVIFSPRSLIVIAIFAIVGALMQWTRLGRDIRALGGDRRASRAAGVPTERILIGIFTCSSVFSALGGALFAYSTTAAKPDLGSAPFIFAVTAVLLGGTSLSGGRGGAGGILIGVLALSFLETLFAILATPAYVINLVRGGLLLLVVIVEAPDLRRRLTVIRARWADKRAVADPPPG